MVRALETMRGRPRYNPHSEVRGVLSIHRLKLPDHFHDWHFFFISGTKNPNQVGTFQTKHSPHSSLNQNRKFHALTFAISLAALVRARVPRLHDGMLVNQW